MLTIIALVCSQLAFPNHGDCLIDNALRRERVGFAEKDQQCEFNGMVAAAATMKIDPATEYLKVLCVRPSVNVDRLPG